MISDSSLDSAYGLFDIYLYPIYPNPAISAHAVFPQSGHIRPEKRPFFQKFPHFSKIEPYKKYEPLIGVQYIILKLMKKMFRKCWVIMGKYRILVENLWGLKG